MNSNQENSTPTDTSASQDGAASAVVSFDPATDPAAITVSPAAVKHLHASLAGNSAEAVRLGVSESGCNGYMYDLSFAERTNPEDHRYEFAAPSATAALTVVVSPADLPLVQGTEIDYVTEGLNSALKFANPNADTHCGCGESFSVASPTDA